MLRFWKTFFFIAPLAESDLASTFTIQFCLYLAKVSVEAGVNSA